MCLLVHVNEPEVLGNMQCEPHTANTAAGPAAGTGHDLPLKPTALVRELFATAGPRAGLNTAVLSSGVWPAPWIAPNRCPNSRAVSSTVSMLEGLSTGEEQ